MNLNKVIKVGTISSVNAGEAKARVKFEGLDGIVSKELPILFRTTKDNKEYFLPSVGETVVCLFLPENPRSGFIIGSFYTKEEVGDSGNIKYQIFKDGTILKVDIENSIITIDTPGDVDIKAAKKVSVATELLNIDSKDINISGENLNIKSTNLNVDSLSKFTKNMTASAIMSGTLGIDSAALGGGDLETILTNIKTVFNAHTQVDSQGGTVAAPTVKMVFS